VRAALRQIRAVHEPGVDALGFEVRPLLCKRDPGLVGLGELEEVARTIETLLL